MIINLLLLLNFMLLFDSYTCQANCNKTSRDIVFVVDSSTSIQDSNDPGSTVDNWELILNFIMRIIISPPLINSNSLRVGLVTYSTAVAEIVQLAYDKYYILNRIKNLRYSTGNTNTSGALWVAGNMLLQDPNDYRQKTIVLITDGQSNVDAHLTLRTAERNKNSGIIQCAVGVTLYADEFELQNIVSIPKSYYYISATNFSHLDSLVNRLLPILTCSKPPLHKPCQDTRIDLAFILDASGSIVSPSNDVPKNFTDWNLMLDFIIDVISELTIGENETRVSVIIFSETAEAKLYLDQPLNISAIKALENIGGGTNISGALMVLNQTVFTEARGDRSDVNNVAIIITDGQSSVGQQLIIPVTNDLKLRKVRIFSIGLTNSINEDELKSMCSRPLSQYYIKRASISVVGTVTNQLVWSVCNEPCYDSTNTQTCLLMT